jgi:hypothetical protein
MARRGKHTFVVALGMLSAHCVRYDRTYACAGHAVTFASVCYVCGSWLHWCGVIQCVCVCGCVLCGVWSFVNAYTHVRWLVCERSFAPLPSPTVHIGLVFVLVGCWCVYVWSCLLAFVCTVSCAPIPLQPKVHAAGPMPPCPLGGA